MTSSILQGGIESCHDILWWNECLDVVHRCKDKASAGRQVIDTVFHLVNHLLRLTKWQHLLGIHTSTPENDVPPELSLQFPGIHTFCRNLDRVQDVKSDLDQIRDQSTGSTTAVIEQLGIRLFLDRLNQAFLLRLDQSSDKPRD